MMKGGGVGNGWGGADIRKGNTKVPSLLNPYPTVGALTVESRYLFEPLSGPLGTQTLSLDEPSANFRP